MVRRRCGIVAKSMWVVWRFMIHRSTCQDLLSSCVCLWCGSTPRHQSSGPLAEDVKTALGQSESSCRSQVVFDAFDVLSRGRNCSVGVPSTSTPTRYQWELGLSWSPQWIFRQIEPSPLRS